MSDRTPNTLESPERLAALHRTQLLGSDTEASFDRLTTLASRIIGAPMSLVSLIVPHRQFFKSHVGLVEPFASRCETSLDYSFCQHVVTSGEPLVIEDATQHPLVSDNPAITELNVVAYLGIPLTTPDGWNLGSFCVIDDHPRAWTADEIDTMKTLATSVANEIQLRLDAARRQALVEQLQQRNQQLDAFSHTVSHNLKNAISGIIGWADVSVQYADRVDKEELLEAMSHILDVAHQTTDTINALLLLAGINLTDDVDLRPLPMFSILEDALTRLEQTIAQSQAKIMLPDSLPDAIGYRDWVEEIWMNYISNALKYGGDPPVLEFGADRLPDQRVRYWVKDNGAGISPEDQANLFKQFSRLSQTKDIEGHGLGLSIVKRIAEKLGGEVAVESTPGEGSTFSFTLPTS